MRPGGGPAAGIEFGQPSHICLAASTPWVAARQDALVYRASFLLGRLTRRVMRKIEQRSGSIIRNPLEGPMSAVSNPARGEGLERNGNVEHNRLRRLTTETKAAFKTTEFVAFLAVLAGILIAAGVVDESNNGGLGAKQAWLYATILTVGYMVSRGLAKCGSSQPYDEDHS